MVVGAEEEATSSPAEGGRRIYVTIAEEVGLLVGRDWARVKEDNSSRSSGGGKVSSQWVIWRFHGAVALFTSNTHRAMWMRRARRMRTLRLVHAVMRLAIRRDVDLEEHERARNVSQQKPTSPLPSTVPMPRDRYHRELRGRSSSRDQRYSTGGNDSLVPAALEGQFRARSPSSASADKYARGHWAWRKSVESGGSNGAWRCLRSAM